MWMYGNRDTPTHWYDAATNKMVPKGHPAAVIPFECPACGVDLAVEKHKTDCEWRDGRTA
jgi:hypothetical protein